MSAADPMPAKARASVVAAAKANIDHGFSRAGHAFKAEDARARAAALLSGRIIAMSDAVVLLALHDHANEAVPILRSLLEASARLGKIAEDGTGRAADDFWKASLALSWEDLFAEESSSRSLRGAAFADAFAAAGAKACRGHFLSNWGGLPWSHVFGAAPEDPAAPDDVLRMAAVAMARALESLNLMWPGRFEGAEEIFSRAEIGSRGARSDGSGAEETR